MVTSAKPRGRSRAAAGDAKLSAADELEIRLARVWFWEGAYARRGINLQRHFTDNYLTVTDLDLLAVEITAQLTSRRAIGEAKSGTGRDAPKPMDRCLWLAGVKQLVGADAAEFVTALRVSRLIRSTASDLGVRPMTVQDLTAREAANQIADVLDVGAHGPTAFARMMDAGKQAKKTAATERAFWFLRDEVWFLEPWLAVKRCIGLLDSLANWWTPDIEDDDQTLLRWLFAETLGVFSLNLVLIAGSRLVSPRDEWHAWAQERLSEGPVPYHRMKALSEGIDRYVAGLLAKTTADTELKVNAMGAFLPEAPPWTESFLELVERLAGDPRTARRLPRHVDLVVHERLVHRRHVDVAVLARVDEERGVEFDRARRQVTAFLRGHARLPEAVDKALTTATSS